MSLSLAPQHSIPSELASETQLGRAARLLDDAQRLLARAGADSEHRHRELAGRIQELEGTLSEMEQLLARTERQAAQLTRLLHEGAHHLDGSLEHHRAQGRDLLGRGYVLEAERAHAAHEALQAVRLQQAARQHEVAV